MVRLTPTHRRTAATVKVARVRVMGWDTSAPGAKQRTRVVAGKRRPAQWRRPRRKTSNLPFFRDTLILRAMGKLSNFLRRGDANPVRSGGSGDDLSAPVHCRAASQPEVQH